MGESLVVWASNCHDLWGSGTSGCEILSDLVHLFCVLLFFGMLSEISGILSGIWPETDRKVVRRVIFEPWSCRGMQKFAGLVVFDIFGYLFIRTNKMRCARAIMLAQFRAVISHMSQRTADVV